MGATPRKERRAERREDRSERRQERRAGREERRLGREERRAEVQPSEEGSIAQKGVRSVELEEKSVGLSGLCQSEVARNVGLSLKSVALAGKSVELSVVKLDLKGVRSVELVGVDEFPLGESHVSLGGRDVLEVHAEGVGEVNQRITFICQN